MARTVLFTLCDERILHLRPGSAWVTCKKQRCSSGDVRRGHTGSGQVFVAPAEPCGVNAHTRSADVDWRAEIAERSEGVVGTIRSRAAEASRYAVRISKCRNGDNGIVVCCRHEGRR